MSLKIAIVGLGNIGNTHARIYQSHEQCSIVAVCDMLAEKAQEAAEQYGCQAFADVPQMLAAGVRPDVASVCTAGEENGSHHYQPTMDLLNAGVAVLGEKPISNNLAEAEEMVALAKKKNLRYGINLNHRFTPAALHAKEWVEQGRLGELNMVDMTMWINNPNESSPHFHMRALHPHSLDVMRYFCGDVTQVQAFFKKGKGRQIWSNAQVNLLFENGVIGHLRGSYDGNFGAAGTYGLETLEVVGSDGRFILRDACENLTWYPRFSTDVESYDYLGGMQHFRETFGSRINRWIEQNLQQVDPAEIDASGADGLAVQRIIEAAIESWESGQVVSLA